MFELKKSKEAFGEAKKYLVAGVNSPVRAYGGFDFPPPFIDRASGSAIFDIDGNEYIDYVGSWGPMILGHAHPAVVAAVREGAKKGTSFGAPTEKETCLAKLINEAFPSMELMRFVSSGTEAVMSAIRVARGHTGRNKIIKFDGCYHGHSDSLLVKAGSGLASFNAPDSSGVPADFVRHTLVAEYNNLSSVTEIVDFHAGDIAAIIVEPVAGNMGMVLPEPGFLKGLRDVCDKHKIVLIFDEVITGFRLSIGGAQALYRIKPDITCLGKIVGGGLPVGVYGGRREIMECVSPLGPVYQAGTLSGNPLAVSAGIATLKILKEEADYAGLSRTTQTLTEGLSDVLKLRGIPHVVNRVESIFTIFFTSGEVRSYRDVKTSKRDVFNKYFAHMLKRGIYFAPSPFECAFVSFAHTDADMEKTVKAAKEFSL